MSHCGQCEDEMDRLERQWEDEIERMSRQWERSETQLIDEIRALQDKLEEANLEIHRLTNELAHGQ